MEFPTTASPRQPPTRAAAVTRPATPPCTPARHMKAASSLHAAMCSTSPCAVAFEREIDDDVDWSARLKLWFAIFDSGSAAFGMVDDWRPDGSSFKRHGVVVELSLDVTRAVVAGDDQESRQQKIREAIDLVQLLLVVKPSALKTILLRRPNGRGVLQAATYQDELKAMARGVPTELRLKMTVQSANTWPLLVQFLEKFMARHDESLSFNAPFVVRRRELIDKLFHRPTTLKRVADSAMHSPLRVRLVISTGATEITTELKSLAFFRHLQTFVTALQEYQALGVAQKGSIVTKHIAFHVEMVELELERAYITAAVVESVKALTSAGIPVAASLLNLDFRLVHCEEVSLCEFVQAITRNACGVVVETGSRLGDDGALTEFADDHANANRVRMTLKAISLSTNITAVNMGDILQLSTTPLCRQAVWQGLIEDVLTRATPLELLKFHNSVDLTEQDGATITQCALRSYRPSPPKRVLARRVDLRLGARSSTLAVCSLFTVIEDLEELSIHFEQPRYLTRQQLASVLRYQDLHSVKLSNVSVATMAIFDPSVHDPLFRPKPKLRALTLHNAILLDTTSIDRFLRRLNPTASETSELAKTLRVLHVHQNSIPPVPLIFNLATVATLDQLLSANRILCDVKISVALSDDNANGIINKLTTTHGDRVVEATEVEKTSKTALALKVAFLSTITTQATTQRGFILLPARYRLDMMVVRQIFEFSGPHKTRKMTVGLLRRY